MIAQLPKGKIVPARGTIGFGLLILDASPIRELTIYLGWDPIFEYEGETYSEMDPEKKNRISHRSIALAKLKNWLLTPN